MIPTSTTSLISGISTVIPTNTHHTHNHRATAISTFITFLYIFSLLLTSPAHAQGLQGDVETIIHDQSLKHETCGISVIDLDNDEQLVSINSNKQFIPASNMKIIATIAALSLLGPDFHFSTRLAIDNNNLVIIGDGDPGLGDSKLLAQNNLDLEKLISFWINEIIKRNITHIDSLIVDDRVFDQQFVHPNWPVKQLDRHYCAQVAGVNFNDNCLDIYATPHGPGISPDITTIPVNAPVDLSNLLVTTTDRKKYNAINPTRTPDTNRITVRGHIRTRQISPVRITINDPPMFLANTLASRLKNLDISINTVRHALPQETFNKASTIAEVRTPLTEIVKRSNKNSVNLFAEALLKRIGRRVTGESGSWANGTATIRAFLAEILGSHAALIIIDDGSGLSQNNRVTPNLITQLLRYADRQPLTTIARRRQYPDISNAFKQSLAIGKTDGTLKKRFKLINLNKERNVTILAKSGTIDNVVALSGYIINNQQTYAFSIILNNHNKSATEAKHIIDLIVGTINNYMTKLNNRQIKTQTNTPATIN